MNSILVIKQKIENTLKNNKKAQSIKLNNNEISFSTIQLAKKVTVIIACVGKVRKKAHLFSVRGSIADSSFVQDDVKHLSK